MLSVEAVLADRLARQIADSGPISLAQYMGLANAHYYAGRDPLGAGGDFTTAPEISQMFGELLGLCFADLWARMGRPNCAYAELGPGRGTLAQDALRAMAAAGLRPETHLVETSPTLRQAQAARVPGATFHDDVAGLPVDRPLLIAANEFFDALPIRQLVRTDAGWRERMVDFDAQAGAFRPVAGTLPMDVAVPDNLRDAAAGTILETSPASAAVLQALAERLRSAGGVALFIDYGYVGPLHGDTLQAVSGHAYADPFAAPGERDLTAHVDFGSLGEQARRAGLDVHGPVTQGAFLRALGIDQRAAALARARPDRAADIARDRDRLVSEGQMGRLFKVMAVTAPGWAAPEGFS